MKLPQRAGMAALLLLAVALAPACGGGAATPTATFKTFFEAAKRRDATAMRRTLSGRMLRELEGQAAEEKKSPEEFLLSAVLPEQMPEVRGEKVSGDSAEIEIRYQGADYWRPLKFVREDGSWKLDSD